MVALPVPENFIFPKGSIAFGCAVTAGAAVPETTVNKHRKFEFWKNEVGLAEDFLVSPPAGDAGIFQQADKSKFRGGIAARPNPRHQN